MLQSIDMTLLETDTEGLAKLAKILEPPVVPTTTGGGAEGPSIISMNGACKERSA